MTLQKIPFNGSYRVFYPSIDTDEHSREIITIALKKLFGSVKVYFTDESEPEVLEEKDNTTGVPPLPPIITKDTIDKANQIRATRGLDPIVGQKVVLHEHVEAVKVDRNEGRDARF
jgi:hypothetical protein